MEQYPIPRRPDVLIGEWRERLARIGPIPRVVARSFCFIGLQVGSLGIVAAADLSSLP